jgi:histidyl-tRNA synthetase
VIRAVKGTRDILPDAVAPWQRLEEAARGLFTRYGYREIRTPIFEETQLFARGLGAETDIVSKEMYTFEDRDSSSLTLRPEATAGIVRAVIEHNLAGSDPLLKVFSLGPMFRRERPQKGRLRQFHQVDVEAFGLHAPAADVEIIEMSLAYLEECGLREFTLVLNSVGDENCRPSYVEVLRTALRAVQGKLCENCQRRIETNPLRVLDCKVPEDQETIEALPKITDSLCGPCKDHFAEVRRELGLLEIPYALNTRLVRGLDYYKRTTFEVQSGALGAQNSVLGGGRYDGLVEELGGPKVPGVGFALGMERLLLALPAPAEEPRCEVFVLPLADRARDKALLLQQSLRRLGLRALMDPDPRSFKAKMRVADKLGARFAVIVGDEELESGVWTLRDMKSSSQEKVGETELVQRIQEKLHG